MSDEKNPETEEETEEETEGTYNPSGGIPSHPADPQYGSGEGKDEDSE